MSKQVIALLLSIGMLFCMSSCDIAVRQAGDASGSSTSDGAESVASVNEESAHIHSYIAETCTSPKKCIACGETIGNALGHNFSPATCTSPQICNRCGEPNGDPLGHDYAAATCFLPQTCTRCEETLGEALGHEYVEDICFRCGEVDPDSLPVKLKELFVVDSRSYDIVDSFTDSFGNDYVDVYTYYNYWSDSEANSIHNLNGKYSAFEGSIVAETNTDLRDTLTFTIFVDGEVKYTKTGFTKITGKVDFSVDVSGGTLLTIKVTHSKSVNGTIGIVDAQLKKR